MSKPMSTCIQYVLYLTLYVIVSRLDRMDPLILSLFQ